MAEEFGRGFAPGFLFAREEGDLAQGFDGDRFGAGGDDAHARFEGVEHVAKEGRLLVQTLEDLGDRDVVLVRDLLDRGGALDVRAQDRVDQGFGEGCGWNDADGDRRDGGGGCFHARVLRDGAGNGKVERVDYRSLCAQAW